MPFEFNFDETFKACCTYLQNGLRIVRLHGFYPDGRCTCGEPECRVGGSRQRSAGKHPVGTNWGERYARDEEDLLSWDDGVPFNVGVILGPKGGVIDVEDDSPEAAAFRESLGMHTIVTPTWTSGKSTHQLFKWDDRLDSCQAVVKPGGLECRLGTGERQTQSVLPPSWHNSGVRYTWRPTMSLDEADVADAPKNLLVQLVNGIDGGGRSSVEKTKYHGPLIFEEVHDGQGRHQRLLLWSWARIIGNQAPLDPIQRQIITQEMLDVNDKRVKPPKSRDEVLQIVNSCFEHYRRKKDSGWQFSPVELSEEAMAREAMAVGGSVSADEAVSVCGLSENGLEPYRVGDVMAWRCGSWKIQMIQGDPCEIRLLVPQWKCLPCEGKVDVSLDTYQSAAKMSNAIFLATRKVLLSLNGAEWETAWKGMPPGKKTGGKKVVGVAEQLLSRKTNADDLHVGASGKRFAQVAAWFQQAFSKATEAADEKPEPNPSGRPCWVNGELWFQWGKITEEIGGPHDVTQGDWRRIRQMLLTAMGVEDFPHRRHSFAGTRREFVVFTPEWIKALESLSVGDAPYTGIPE